VFPVVREFGTGWTLIRSLPCRRSRGQQGRTMPGRGTVIDKIPVAVRRQTQRTSCSGSGTEGSSTTLLADLHGHARASCQRERGVVPNNLPADENYTYIGGKNMA
jgi:hypothetical protein